MSIYPIFLKPQRFISLEKSKPELPIAPPEPSKPKLIKKNWFEKLILAYDDFDDAVINSNRLSNHENNLKKYKSELEEYQKKVNEILSETNILIFRNERKRETLKKTIFADPSTRETLKGRYEAFFKNYLASHFGSKIYDNLEFCLPNGNAFVPDFAYVDKETGLCIDIEIDEPYTSDTKMPIHCLGDDDFRNAYFQNKGWFVIRFAEIQIFKYPEKCCDFISSIIKEISSGYSYNVNIPTIECWDYIKSSEMVNLKTRDNY